MRHTYRWVRPLLAALLIFMGFTVQAQQVWRPFRLGLIYAYKEASGSNTNLIHTLRADSAYATPTGDSVYAFNRRLRSSAGTTFPQGSVKSRNNLFGALLRWRPGQKSYTLEALAQADVQAPVSLELFPQAPVGSTWNASTQPLRTATLLSRNWETISPGVEDSVAVINVTASGTTTAIRLSRRYGLLAGPQWLGGATGLPLVQAALPATFEQSLYNPLRLFDVRPGDEFGYQEVDVVSPVQCSDKKKLRRIVSRRLTADSLVITYQEQLRDEEFGYAGVCSLPARVTYGPITIKRWAMARVGNQWEASGATLQLGALRLLTGEYVPGPANSYLLVGLPIGSGGAAGCAPAAGRISYTPYYWRNRPQSGATPIYGAGLDYDAWQYSFAPGFTTSFEGWDNLIYSRKSVNGVTQVCGSPQGFVNLLPTRAAQAAALATLHPNPATESATLTLAQPARVGQVLTLTDVLGRNVWSAPVPAGQTTVAVPLAGQPAGLYLLTLSGPAGHTGTWKLHHE
ncbi:hypothetical protein IC235_01220 [Hymenobacter sp. BT664]|uniref:T9SS type A sorting domain-containing protein n=1 Tax=Hymenobacter montanus TaxID=2771359 RepID=A0A927GHW4_9BACT|nr:hypothetical protein [Hymenobacter montanus]MBD2766509.1 hypothetical protein [Hymenobacter montanus]